MTLHAFEEMWLKGSSALRLSGKMYRGEWGVWLEFCRAIPGMEKRIPPKGGRKYNWEEDKLVFRLTRKDLTQIGSRLDAPHKGLLVDLYHHYEQKKKRLQISMNETDRFFVKAQETAFDSSAPGKAPQREIAVLLDAADFWGFKECVRLAYKGSLCSNENGSEEQAK